MRRTSRTHLRQVVLAAALAALVAAPAAHADLAVQHYHTDAVETAGNGNGIPEPGDTLAITEQVISVDPDQDYTGVTGTISSSAPGVTITSGSSPYPDMSFATIAANSTPFAVSLDSSMECGVALPFNLNLQTSAGPTDVAFTVPTGQAGAAVPYDNSQQVGIPDNNSLGATSSVSVGGDGGRAKHVVVRIGQITHTYDGDLTIYLVAPDGRSVMLVSDRGDNGQNFTNTVFDDNAAAGITSNTPAPFTGTFKPAESLSAMDGAPLAGTWSLKVVDDRSGNFGSIDSWGADIAPAVCAGQSTPPPPPPPLHDCGKGNGNGSGKPPKHPVTCPVKTT
jgi:subtilisin-like proprotein convertase family protein